MAGHVVHVQLEVLAVERGIWCPACALPSGGFVAFVQHLPDGTMTTSRVRRCSQCGEPIPEP